MQIRCFRFIYIFVLVPDPSSDKQKQKQSLKSGIFHGQSEQIKKQTNKQRERMQFYLFAQVWSRG